MKRNLLVVGIAALAGIFLFLNPLQYLAKRRARHAPRGRTPPPSPRCATTRDAHWRSPEDYVVPRFAVA